MPTANHSRSKAQTKIKKDTVKQLQLIATKLDKITSRMDATLSLLLDFLLSDPQYEEPIEYTDKVARLGKLGIEQDVISRIVRRPSNYVSSRLRESKSRKFSRRQRRVSKLSSFGTKIMPGHKETSLSEE